MDHKTVTLLGSDLLFIAVSLLFILHPEIGPVAYPFYGLLFLWSDWRREGEASVIFAFLVTAAGIVLATRSPLPVDKVVLAGEVVGIWILNGALSLHRSRFFKDLQALEIEKQRLELRVREDERDLKYYQSYQENADTQIRLRRDLTESARSLGSAMDARQVQERLMGILSLRFPGARVDITSAAGADAALQAAERNGPFLAQDRRVMAVPLKIMHRAAGFLKLESDNPHAFRPEDLKTVDLFATMAALSLENIQFYEHIQAQATHDPLTQLYSHKAFQDRLQEELLRAGRAQTPLSFILCDLDHFKSYNDRYGHQAGDHLLRTVAAVLAGFARPVDFPARYGGEEFCLILPNFVRREAVELANRIRLRVACEPFVFQGEKTSATMSIGVSGFPQDATTPSQIIRVADERLYKAKQGGRNQVVG